MAFCKYHSDINCDECKDLNGEEQNKNLQKEIVAEEENAAKNEGNLGVWIGSGIVMLIIAGCVVLGCWLNVPGFLKPDKEVTFVSFDGYVTASGELEMRFLWNGDSVSQCTKLDVIDVDLRSDGKFCTTLVLKDRKSPDWYYCKRVTILVPNREGLGKWNEFLAGLRKKYEDSRRAKEEEINRLSMPREVLPPNK